MFLLLGTGCGAGIGDLAGRIGAFVAGSSLNLESSSSSWSVIVLIGTVGKCAGGGGELVELIVFTCCCSPELLVGE